MAKKKYYTKCNRQFLKSSTADVTGFVIENFENLNSKCRECPFILDIKKGYPEAVHERYECRAGSEPPNTKNDYRGNADDKTSLHILSIDPFFLQSVLDYCENDPELSAGYASNDEIDCRRCISVSCSANKKGIAAKKNLVKLFFSDIKKEDTEFDKITFLYKAGKTISDLVDIVSMNPHGILQHLKDFGQPIRCEEQGCEFEHMEEEMFFVCYDCGKFVCGKHTLIKERADGSGEKYCSDCFKKETAQNPDIFTAAGLPDEEPTPSLSERTHTETPENETDQQLRIERLAELCRINRDFKVGIDLAELSDVEWERVCQNAEKANKREAHAMFNQEFQAVLNSVTTKTVQKNIDGQKIKEAAYKIIIETNDIDYESLESEAPYIHGIITYNEIMQFKSVNFGEIVIKDLSMSLRGVDENGDISYSAVEIQPVKIINLTVVNKVNIPHYFFSLEMPKTIPGRYLLDNLKGMVRVSLNKPAGLFDNIKDVKVTVKGV